MNGPLSKSSVFAAITGNIIEWYDFTLYLFLAPVIAQQFFPTQNHWNALLSTFTVFAVGFFVRPLGSLLMGHLGDRYGRKITLKLTMLLISLPALGLAFLPNYQHWGIYASICLVCLRLLQGLCIGGEFAGSMIYLTEMAKPHQQTLMSAMANNGSNLGTLAASLIAALVASSFSESHFYHYGWRIPFLIGGLIGLVGLWLRRDLSETPVYMHLKRNDAIPPIPLMVVLRTYKKQTCQIFLLLIMAASGSYVLMDFMSTYLHLYFHYTLTKALAIQSIYNALTLLLVTLFAYYSDQYGRRLVLIIAAMGYIIFSIPCFYLLGHTGIALVLLPLIIFYCLEEAAMPAAMVELFPANARYTGISLGYNIAMALIGGTAPLVNTWLVSTYHNPLMIGYYLAIAAFISFTVIVKTVPSLRPTTQFSMINANE